MLVRKCDRCGRYYDNLKEMQRPFFMVKTPCTMVESRPMPVIEKLNESKPQTLTIVTVDLCDECEKSLEKWYSEIKENKEETK